MSTTNEHAQHDCAVNMGAVHHVGVSTTNDDVHNHHAKVIDTVHQTHLAEAIKMLGRAIGMASQKQRKHWWQRSYFNEKELALLSSRLTLLFQLNKHYEQWHDQLQLALEKNSVEQYDDLQAILRAMKSVAKTIVESSGQRKQFRPAYNQLMSWVKEEVLSFLHEVSLQHDQLGDLDRVVKAKERDLVSCILAEGRHDIHQVSLRMARLYQHLNDYREEVQRCYGKSTLNQFSLWIHSSDPMRSFASMCQSFQSTYTDVCQLSIELEQVDAVGSAWPASFSKTSLLVDMYSRVAKMMFNIHLMLLDQKKSSPSDVLLYDLHDETRAVFDTVKSLRASQLVLLLYKIDHHRHSLNGSSDDAQIVRLLAGEDFEILRYSKKAIHQPNEVKRISHEINQDQGYADTPKPLGPLFSVPGRTR